MPPPTREELHRLHLVNALFAHVTGHDLYLAQQIADAITTSVTEAEGRPPAEPEFVAAAARLLERMCAHVPRHGFAHWDAAGSLESATPLFLRAGLMQALKRLASFSAATVLVTNLRPALLPASGRETERVRRDYAEAVAFVRDLAAARTLPGIDLTVLFL